MHAPTYTKSRHKQMNVNAIYACMHKAKTCLDQQPHDVDAVEAAQRVRAAEGLVLF